MSTRPVPNRWSEVDDLFDRSLALEPAERQRFVAEQCGGDATLRREVHDLLRADARAGGFLRPLTTRSVVRVLAAAFLDESPVRKRAMLDEDTPDGSIVIP